MIISVQNLTKQYRFFASARDRLIETLSFGIIKRHKPKTVLSDISFSIAKGESVAIIGRNGAGKSTLLKIISGTTHPTSGVVNVFGRIAAILELGMSFHTEFTGRQNILIAGQLMGFSVDEVNQSDNYISQFSELGEYLDQPIKTYSTGMLMRLAFSIATCIQSDILIIDEALSVGDIRFQQKCIERIKDLKKAGTTILFVSHDPTAVRSICDRAILIEGGGLAKVGSPQEVLDYYNAIISKDHCVSTTSQSTTEIGIKTESGSKKITIQSVRVLDAKGRSSEILEVAKGFSVEIVVTNQSLDGEFTIGFSLKDRLANEVFGTNSHYLKRQVEAPKSKESLTVRFDLETRFSPGNYTITACLVGGSDHLENNYHWIDKAATFTVVANNSLPYFVGHTYIPSSMEIG